MHSTVARLLCNRAQRGLPIFQSQLSHGCLMYAAHCFLRRLSTKPATSSHALFPTLGDDKALKAAYEQQV